VVIIRVGGTCGSRILRTTLSALFLLPMVRTCLGWGVGGGIKKMLLVPEPNLGGPAYWAEHGSEGSCEQKHA